MNAISVQTIKSCIDSLEELMDNMKDRGDFDNEDGMIFTDAMVVKQTHSERSALLTDPVSRSRVLVTVSGGVADYIADDFVDVEVFDFDNYEDDPGNTALPSERFRHLANQNASIATLYEVEVA